MNGAQGSFGGTDVFSIMIVMAVSQVYTCVKTYQTVYLPCVQVGQLCVHKAIKNCKTVVVIFITYAC